MDPFVPQGSEALRYYAKRSGYAYEARPGEDFFRRFEPHDTLVSPEAFYNAVTARAPWGGSVTLVEPWTAGEGLTPIERTVLAFAIADGLKARGAMRVGEPYLTRVAFLESAPPKRVTLGDPAWDEHVTTFAATEDEALRAFPPSVRRFLRRRGFVGQIEMRPGGFVLHEAERGPSPDDYEAVLRLAIELGQRRIARR